MITVKELIDNNMPSVILFAMSQMGIGKDNGDDTINVTLDDATDKNAESIQQWIDEFVSEGL